MRNGVVGDEPATFNLGSITDKCMFLREPRPSWGSGRVTGSHRVFETPTRTRQVAASSPGLDPRRNPAEVPVVPGNGRTVRAKDASPLGTSSGPQTSPSAGLPLHV